MRVAVVGGGIFGVTAAAKLSRAGFDVSLFEQNRDLLQAASGINQYRLHRGYHYPRSDSTAASSRDSEASFIREFGSAIIKGTRHFYCIARDESLTTPKQFLDFCDDNGLQYQEVKLPIVRRDMVDLSVEVQESLFDPVRLRRLCWDMVNATGVHVHLGTRASATTLHEFDFSVVATYAANNNMLEDFPSSQEDYQFEICEKPVVQLPGSFNGLSTVILDGPFMCVDPFGHSGNFVLGNVVHAIHHTNIGRSPEVDEGFRSLLNRGIVKNPPVTNFRQFVESGACFMPELAHAEHLGSMFTIRTVLPFREATDERPTLVRKAGDGVYSLFSGKVGTCIVAAQELCEAIARDAGLSR